MKLKLQRVRDKFVGHPSIHPPRSPLAAAPTFSLYTVLRFVGAAASGDRGESTFLARTQLQALFVGMLALLCLTSAIQGAEPAAADPAKMEKILGSVADWKVAPAQPIIGGGPGQPTLSAAEALTLESSASHAVPVECLVSYRPKLDGATINIQLACATRPGKPSQTLTFYVSAAHASNVLNYSMTVEGGKASPPPMTGTLFFDAVTDRSLAWSDEMRKTVEAQIAAAPKVADTVVTLRWTLEKGRFRAWVHGRFVGEMALGLDFASPVQVKLQATPGTEIASVRIRPLEDVSARFEPLSIAGNLNAAPLNGEKVDLASLPGAFAASKLESVDEVPFMFPVPSSHGEDHIDVGRSWTRFGALGGDFASCSGTFGGRWVSADRVDPARIAMYIPKGRYKALHLIAISDGRKDSVPVVTAQFYRHNAGHPFNFAGTIPAVTGGDAKAVSVKLADGRSARLHHVVIPLEPDAFSWFTDANPMGLEITKQVQFYRAYPDPTEYSWHGAGLPSSAQIYAMTLERAGVEVDLEPDQYGHVWTAPTTPRYNVILRNRTGAATTAKLMFTTRGADGKETPQIDTHVVSKEVALTADGAPVKVPIELKPKRHGLHVLTLEVDAGGESAKYQRNFAWLHEDTRERKNWESGRGSVFGFWDWGGGHDTPTADKELPFMAAAGAETSTMNYSQSSPTHERPPVPAIKALAEKHHFFSEAAFVNTIAYITGFGGPEIQEAPVFDRTKPEESGKQMIEAMRKWKYKPDAVSRPTYVPFFTEPNLYPITTGTWPTYWGDKDYELTKGERDRFEDMLAKYLAGAGAIRKEWPDLKLLMPYGEPLNAAVFMKLSPEIRGLIDGCALDMPGFERLPEQQINQVVFNRMYPTMKDIRQYKADPYLVMIEGFCVSSKDIDTGETGKADIVIRDYLLLMGYGVTRFESAPQPFDCANYWGEQHYGGGLCSRLPVVMQQPAYVHFATLTRHLNRANFTKYVPTGSTSAYCEQFKHYKTGKLVHALWTIRGTRRVNVKVAPGTALELYDPNDNLTKLKEKDGMVTFDIAQSPCYLEGLKADAVIELGESDHSDAQPAEEIAKIGNPGDGSWKMVAEVDEDYTKNKPLQIERFQGKMSASVVDISKGQGGPTPPGYVVGSKALAVHLEKQDKDRGVMPFYTTLEPKSPIVIPGKASHLGLWVHAASDWGRVVYSLRDAKGEKWLSVGTKEEWNNDDIHCWSAFCFDGWRYLRFELPSSAPYDSYREYGTTWWGSTGGDGVVDLPLKLEKIIVERRPKVIYGNDLVDAKPDDVLLGDLNAEYASASDRSAEAVRLSKLRMPAPENAPELGNPIADFAKTGVGVATKVLRVTDPERQYDGTRCHVHFDLVPGAKNYNVWVSPYVDGRGAMQLGSGWTESGKLIEGLRPDIKFHLFVVYTDKDDKVSKPSAPLAFILKDGFGNK